MQTIKEQILREGKVTAEMRRQFFPNLGFRDIRDWLEKHDIDRHYPLELESTEIALHTPEGVLMQIRATDKNQLGLWGGVLKNGETPVEGALREFFQETGIQLTTDQLEFVEFNEHYHKYSNGDQAYFKSYRYVVRFDYVPELTLDSESAGVFMVSHTILAHQQEFVKEILNEN